MLLPSHRRDTWYVQAPARPAETSSQNAPAARFDIPPGPLATVAAAFEAATGVALDLRGLGWVARDLQSPGATGVFSVEAALRQILTGSPVTYRFLTPTSVVLEIRVATDAVDVMADAPVPFSRYSQPLRDVPQTINIVPRAVIEAQAATSLRDVLRNVPGITYQAGEGGGGLPGDNLTMRGFSAGNDLFVDGFRDPGAYSRDAFNLEQLEVAKGPSSSIAGRGATGGAINQVTKTPTLNRAGSTSVSGGTADARRVVVDMNHPIPPVQGMAVRINAMWTDAGVPGRDVVHTNSWGLAPAVTFGLGTPTRLTLNYQHLSQDNVPDYGLPWAALEAGAEVDQSNFYGLRDYDYERIESDAGTVRIEHDPTPSLRLRNLSRYASADRDSAITAPRPPNRQLQQRTMGNDLIANQTTISAFAGHGRLRHAITGGIEVAREETANRNRSQTANQPATTLVSPDPSQQPLGPMPPNTGNPGETRVSTLGAYAFDTLSIGDAWQLSGGARVDHADVRYGFTDLATGAHTALRQSDAMLSWRAAATFKPKAEGSVYVGVGTSFNPSVDAGTTGAALSTNPTAVNNINLDPEESRSVEIGTKWDLAQGRAAISSAVFRTEKTNARTRNATDQPFILAGRQRVEGVELSVSGQPIRGWTVLAAAARMSSEFAQSANPAEQGNDLALTPKTTLNLWTTVELRRRLTAGGGVQYMDGVYRNAINTLTVPGYWLGSAMVSYAVNEHLTLRTHISNVADRQYVDRASGGHYIPGPRRQVTAGLDVRF
jgi:catecholate siderophore receptor